MYVYTFLSLVLVMTAIRVTLCRKNLYGYIVSYRGSPVVLSGSGICFLFLKAGIWDFRGKREQDLGL